MEKLQNNNKRKTNKQKFEKKIKKPRECEKKIIMRLLVREIRI